MYMGNLFTACFGPKGPSSANPFVKITEKSYWVMSGVYKSHLYVHHTLSLLI
jgi:hypothetical protein